jgi:hypothetical protein
VTVSITRFPAPVFCTVIASVVSEPTVTVPKLRLDGLTLIAGGTVPT